jgi:hypothetical protein
MPPAPIVLKTEQGKSRYESDAIATAGFTPRLARRAAELAGLEE